MADELDEGKCAVPSYKGRGEALLGNIELY